MRTSYQVGSPCMLEGKIFLGVAGTPILKTDLANIRLALAEPVPFTLAKRTVKSFIFIAVEFIFNDMILLYWLHINIFAYPMLRLGIVRRIAHNASIRLHLLPLFFLWLNFPKSVRFGLYLTKVLLAFGEGLLPLRS